MGQVMRFSKIDVHMHLAGTGCCASGCWVSPSFEKRFSFRALKFLQGISEKQLHTSIDGDWAQRIAELIAQSEVDYGVVLGFDGVYHHKDGYHDEAKSQMIIPPEWVFRVCRTHSGLLPGPSINPHRRDSLRQLEFCIEQGAVLIKWLPAAQAINPAETRLHDFYKMLASARIPLLIHMGGEKTFKSVAPEFNDVNLLVPPLQAGVKVICAHSGTRIITSQEPDQLPRLRELLREFPHLWLDNSGLLNPARFLHAPKLANDNDFASRTLYGSDWPVPSNSFYFTAQLGLKKVIGLETMKNPINRDIMTKRLLGYPEDTLTRANLVLANLHRWGSSS